MAISTGYVDRKLGIEVLVIPALEDNYIYVLAAHGRAAVVDPAEAEPVLRLVRQRSLKVTHILVTHHHHDHVAGVPDLKAAMHCKVVGPSDPRIPGLDETVGEGDRVDVEGFSLRVLSTPGHSHTHVVYHDADRRLLWSGDTLFGGGCGRLFDCPPELMWNSLNKLAALADDTLVFFGHEYTEENLRFAATVDPDNAELAARRERVAELRRVAKPTSPSSIGMEKKTNPFLRADLPPVRRALNLEGAPAVQAFAELRRRKDSF